MGSDIKIFIAKPNILCILLSCHLATVTLENIAKNVEVCVQDSCHICGGKYALVL